MLAAQALQPGGIPHVRGLSMVSKFPHQRTGNAVEDPILQLAPGLATRWLIEPLSACVVAVAKARIDAVITDEFGAARVRLQGKKTKDVLPGSFILN